MEKVYQYLNLIFCIDNADKETFTKENYELALKTALDELDYYKNEVEQVKTNTYDSTMLINIDDCRERFDALKEHRLMESKWRIWYNAWLSGRSLMLMDIFRLQKEVDDLTK